MDLTESPAEFRTTDNPNLVALRKAASTTLLHGLGAAQKRLEAEYHDSIKAGQIGLFGLLAVVLGTLLGTGYFIFNPLFRKIIEQKRVLFELALTDPLTGCQNRRNFHEFAAKEFERTHRYGSSTVVVAIDIDEFKGVNDTHGHPVGDKVIKRLVEICLSNIRSSDHLGRLGGEEFAIILIETTVANATMVAEKIRAAFQNAPIDIESGRLTCTASFGVTRVLPTDKSIHDALSRADALLYQAKEKGRNRVVAQNDADA